ncbi:hypothetical protein HPQ64_10955 [Rhizobiales bacterium]|uniref:sirohydrochlorin chelatase n=1 Tax=Hongsoonwoonella zoysiae TaxID=2821844 RepID=UPI0015614D00|nr:CbiX/SirB N-terminal domain-containing protein [Hongsoonwoonella zoysiae]NRG18210.1 hypothetical protein [Hongsoonwoonella zoysiae]
MSGTRSPSPKAPAIKTVNGPVLLAVAHGAGAREDANDGFLAFCRELGERLPDFEVRPAVLNGEPSLETVMARVGEDRGIVVYPHFLSDGYYVSKALPRRLENLGRSDARILTPLGLMAGLSGLVARNMRRELSSAQLPPIVVVAHGSAMGKRPRKAAETFASSLGREMGQEGIPCLFLEEAPLFEEALPIIGANFAVVRYFAANGGHSEEDVANALKLQGHAGYLSPPVGLMPGVAELVTREIAEVLGVRHGERQRLTA